MHKTIGSLVLGFALVASPLFASAQTTSSSNTSLLASLEAFVAQLTQELQQLIAAKQSSTPAPTQTQNTTPVSSSSNSFANLCAAYAHMEKGNTDASTGGQVTQLQSFLGISPATGYYGAQTSIAYQNKCGNLGNSQPASVPGMSEYTDSNFGFSFWYPSGWIVNKIRSGSASNSPWEIWINTSNNNGQTVAILETTDDSVADASGSYYFDAQAGTWMHQGVGSQLPQAADVSNNTMGGLHIFSGNSESFVPLSANKFLTISTTWSTDKSINADYLTDTILATNPAVAIAVSTAQQTATIQAEANAYGITSANTSNISTNSFPSSLQTYTNSQYGFSVQYDPNNFTTTAASVMPFMGYPNVPDTLLSLNYTGDKNIAGFDGANITIAASNTTTYEDCTHILSSSDSEDESATKQVTINGRTFYQGSTGDAATGHYSSTNSYSIYYNGACYEAFLQIDTSRTADGTSPADVTSVSNALQTVFDSLTFTTPNTAPALHASASPAWATFVGQQTPTSFSYPGSFLVYESEDESDIGPGVKAGLQTFQDLTSAGTINVQMTPSKYLPAGDSATQAMQAAMKTDPIAYPSYAYTSMTLGGEPAYVATSNNGTSVIYVAHDNNYFRILLWAPLLSQEYQNFVNGFRFTQ